ncbi:MAG: methylmalonyl-CoA mutase [Ignavibacteria bacterium RIFOXYB2_FULL_35_12]|nr:MAG: methylmalonyl-CoA mutase [Ignavibacteria bacterium GWA2_36_19]OGU56649.1 MAG: methylmalonyl-CoA mutase [Ignavibacteria bacterium GWF2_35_20]OGU86366.1 MAG: methylmalonyl-CoA mutase [Ignavibacteria bacterium RIFOXYA12_FULL_35_25]OGU87788.1 MAG: methylmalonyl-CoA mutase [Ignavibacteria bacterium RIFOXYC12_FULL_35_11]OGU96358.1 MAG: methylmalonyl-CoA mutase [Ignavibacteria bacterium RIFOXYB12_FULL_35_14]OGV01526.1 MAG: methylmalonyl-CoA mutase [Ignavibacteria bacterium RIFOXYC2_FULL_35_16
MKSNYKERRNDYQKKAEAAKNSGMKFTTVSGEPIEMFYGPDDIENINYLSEIGFPGEYPYTRGIHVNGYRGKIWTMRQFAGFGSPEDTNKRFHYLLNHGQTGLSVAFDLPTLMGWNSDSPMSEGEVGICGVSISSLEDMEILFDKIPLDKVSTSMTINSPAAMIFAFYLAVAKKQNVDLKNLRGTLQNDILKEYIAQKEYIYPPHPSMRIIVDMIEYCAKDVPQWNPVSVSGYHIREAGSTAVQELAYTLADGFAYIEACIERGMDVDEFAPRISFFFNSHLDFFEEIAKFRAARKIYAKRMKERYGAKNPRSWWMRFHTQTAGCTLTAQQPENNIVRTAFQALAGVLGGTQSLHTNSMDETLALPSEKAVKIALRTQQIIAYETGVINTVDPLGGSYFVEALTDKMEKGANEIFEQIDTLGGVIPAIESGYFQKEIADAAYRYQKEIERKEKFIVGVNEFVEENEKIDIPILTVSPEVEKMQRERLTALRSKRNRKAVENSLEEIRIAAAENRNLMPLFVDAALNYVTLGEMTEELKKVFGVYEETAVF